MTRDEPKGQDNTGRKILQFPLRDGADKRSADIDQMLDLSRYEKPRGYTEDYKARMVENVAAVVLLSALVAVAAYDFIGLEQSQRCAYAIVCSLSQADLVHWGR
jgi:hypothetical protein